MGWWGVVWSEFLPQGWVSGCQVQALQGGACCPFLTLGLALPGVSSPSSRPLNPILPTQPHANCWSAPCLDSHEGPPCPPPIQAFVLPLTLNSVNIFSQ